MKKFKLGDSGIEVTELCFGALPMGPLQKGLDIESAASVVAKALKGGVTFIDTAQAYKTYLPIKKAIQQTGIIPVIASKSSEPEYHGMEDAVYEALEMLELEKIDIFHLHAARGDRNLFKLRAGAFKALLDLKEKNKIRAVGVSCHSADLVSVSADVKELDIVFPLINYTGMGIIGGTLSNMEKAIIKCRDRGKGIYLMKVLAGGNLVENYGKALTFARSLGNYPIALGMVSEKEVDYNLSYFNADNTDDIPNPTFEEFNKRFQVVKRVCIGCGNCIKTCASSAVSIIEGKACIDTSKCIMCGYCVASCPRVAIRPV